jgi:hypothetical protein
MKIVIVVVLLFGSSQISFAQGLETLIPAGHSGGWSLPDTIDVSFAIYGAVTTHEHFESGFPNGESHDTIITKNSVLTEPRLAGKVKFSASDATITANQIHIKDVIPASTVSYTVDMDIDTLHNIISDYSYYRSYTMGANATEEECSLHMKNISIVNNEIVFIDSGTSAHGVTVTYRLHDGHVNHYIESYLARVDSLRIFGYTLIAPVQQKVDFAINAESNFHVRCRAGELNIGPLDEVERISIFDMVGNRRYQSGSLFGNNIAVSTAGWSTGIYIVVVQTKNSVQSQKIIVKY